MVDRWVNSAIHPVLNRIANLVPEAISANMLTVAGLGIGLLAVPLLWCQFYFLALCTILLNRFLDGMDGAIARKKGVTDLGGFLDITCDFIFYSAVILGFALADAESNALAAVFLVFSFIGTGSSFLAFAIIAEKKGIASDSHGKKSFYYLSGLTEGTETILFYVLICLFPHFFPFLAVMFGCMCWITVAGRFGTAYTIFR